ncbi:MAG: hypothetical protein ABIY40_00315 [Rhodanobacteraceae bacterium]|nr:hypothetical protein [Pseudomonadota bacterium]
MDHDAVVFERDCGAGSGFASQVSVLSRGAKAWGYGTAFEIGDYSDRVPMDTNGVVPIQLRWEGSKHLLITFPKEGRIYLASPRVNGVAITYFPVN